MYIYPTSRPAPPTTHPSRSCRFATVLLTVAASAWVSLLPAQQLSGTVVSDESGEAIDKAFVFVANSTVGTTTDRHGRFHLSMPDLTGVLVIFSQRGYELYSYDLGSGSTGELDTVYLVPKRLASNPEAKTVATLHRRRLTRRFSKAFLGDVPTRQIYIENPNVLIFSDGPSGWQVEASDAVLIVNRVLGYRMSFYLNRFKQAKDGTVEYDGNAFFQELPGSARKKKSFARNREQIYDRSSRKFFADLVSRGLDQIGYEVGFSRIHPHQQILGGFEKVDTLVTNQLNDDHYELVVAGCLTIIDHQTVSRHRLHLREQLNKNDHAARSHHLENATSHIYPRASRIVVNKYGRILNPKEIQEFGYWATIRAGALLPFDYSPDT